MLSRITRPSDEVRVPEVPRGSAVIATRYREEVAKVALVNPEDLAMLERSHELLEGLDHLTEAPPPSDSALESLKVEERSHPSERIEDADEIAAILRL